MLEKVLKYDFKYIGRRLFPLYLITIGLCVLTRGLYILADKFNIFAVLSFFTNVSGLAMLVAIIVFTFIIIIKRFYTNLFKEEGYLTNVLPVKINTHILSKFICSLTFNVLSILVVIGSFFIMYYSIELTEDMSYMVEYFKKLAIHVIILIIFTLQAYQMLVCASYSIGQRKDNKKIIYSIISGIGLYFGTQVIALISIFIVSKVEPNYLELLESGNMDAIKGVLVIASALAIINSIIYYAVMAWSLNKRMDLE